MKCYAPLFAITALTFGTVAEATAETIDPAPIWTQHCKKCHAEDGSGSTKMGQKFGVKDYTDAAVQAAMSDEEIIQVTQEGVVENGKKKMPPYAAKLTDEEIAALVPYIRAFKK